MSIRYAPHLQVQPLSLEEALSWLKDEYARLAHALHEPQMDTFTLTKLYAAPHSPEEGMVVLADGTSWNPGSGAGFYGYYGAAWVKLG